MADTKPDAEALLPCPFCGSSAELEHHTDRWSVGCTENGEPPSKHECIGYISLTTFARKSEAIAAWNTRAALSKSSVAPEDEALIKMFGDTLYRFRKEPSSQNYDEMREADEALRRHIAGLAERARLCAIAALQWENRWALKEAERMELHVKMEDAERELATAESALAACRDKTIDECAADILLQASDLDKDTPGGHGTHYYIEHTLLPSIRALKTQETTNG